MAYTKKSGEALIFFIKTTHRPLNIGRWVCKISTYMRADSNLKMCKYTILKNFCKKSVPKWHIFGLYIRKKGNISYFESCCLYCRTKSGLPDRPQVAIWPLNFSDGFLRAFYCNDATSAIQTAWLSDCPKLIRFRAVFVLHMIVKKHL